MMVRIKFQFNIFVILTSMLCYLPVAHWNTRALALSREVPGSSPGQAIAGHQEEHRSMKCLSKNLVTTLGPEKGRV